jgi:hypothetical protein
MELPLWCDPLLASQVVTCTTLFSESLARLDVIRANEESDRDAAGFSGDAIAVRVMEQPSVRARLCPKRVTY